MLCQERTQGRLLRFYWQPHLPFSGRGQGKWLEKEIREGHGDWGRATSEVWIQQPMKWQEGSHGNKRKVSCPGQRCVRSGRRVCSGMMDMAAWRLCCWGIWPEDLLGAIQKWMGYEDYSAFALSSGKSALGSCRSLITALSQRWLLILFLFHLMKKLQMWQRDCFRLFLLRKSVVSTFYPYQTSQCFVVPFVCMVLRIESRTWILVMRDICFSTELHLWFPAYFLPIFDFLK